MLRAFFFSGRFKVSQAMPMFSSMLAVISFSVGHVNSPWVRFRSKVQKFKVQVA